MEELYNFLRKRCLILESVEAASSVQTDHSDGYDKFDNRKRNWSKAFSATEGRKSNDARRPRTQTNVSTSQQNYNNKSRHMSSSNKLQCPICDGKHWFNQCDQLDKTSIEDRFRAVIKANLCRNCLRSGHYANECKSGGCRKCNHKHNTLLHKSEVTKVNEKIIAHVAQATTSTVLLSTAMVALVGSDGCYYTVRALLDSGSMSNFMTARLASKLNLKINATNIKIGGIGGSHNNVRGLVKTTLSSSNRNFKDDLTFIVLREITDQLPTTRISETAVVIPNCVQLADPTFNTPGHIDILLGAELFFHLLTEGKMAISDSVMLQNTVFGWVIAGRVPNENFEQNIQCYASTLPDVDRDLNFSIRRFWEIEEINHPCSQTSTETKCEIDYKRTTSRDATGRYTVHLPLKHDILKQIGNTRDMAVRRFLSLEKRFETNTELKAAYSSFMTEYLNLGHMHLQKDGPNSDLPEFFLPHHGVIRMSSTTTKLRVVFDASAKSTTGVSLNDALMVGPTVQDNLFGILIRFRIHQFVITGDIEKMYRQINVHEPHTNLQKIIWREGPSEPMKTYILNTVTYGTSAAPYLAIRTLKQLANDESMSLPRAAEVCHNDFYVDDILTGADSLEETKTLQQDLIELCSRGGLSLRKWCANHPDLLRHLTPEAKGIIHEMNWAENCATKTLGVCWMPASDQLQYNVSAWVPPKVLTKRVVASDLAKLFDPLGLVGPIVVRAKIFIQNLWRLNISWDSKLPPESAALWTAYRNDLKALEEITVKRRVVNNHEDIQIHVFCDASENAYGACVYLRSINTKGECCTNLLCSKSRVSPLKHISIPRLELCAALLGARLLNQVVMSLKANNISSRTLWTDSMVALGWITAEGGSRGWKTFVANRIAEIHELTGDCKWFHVPTNDNPADKISRGMLVKELMHCELWWKGPKWLSQDETEWPSSRIYPSGDQLPERRETKMQALTVTTTTDDSILVRFSKLERLQRVTGYILRFAENCRVTAEFRKLGPLEPAELKKSLDLWIRHAQRTAFESELKSLRDGKLVNEKGQIRKLHPFLDSDRILRVSGRLQNANLIYDQRHPIILAKGPFVRLLIGSEHRRLLHAGPGQMLASLRQQYWVIGARNMVRKEVQNCTKCFRWRTKDAVQLMGSLPSERVNPSPPFHVSGVDYAGPFNLRVGGRRSRTTTKAYVALFVCFTTRAVHLELVSDLTTECFLAAFRRFIARRGKPRQINSDNGTNFVGADKALEKFLIEVNKQNLIQEELSVQGIEWKFIPAHSPHFGGLWESGVRVTKHHLRRIVANQTLSFEEYITILAQIEAVLNSRPITPSSSNPQDFEALTPGHFLIGRSLTSLPEPDYTNTKAMKQRWHLIQQMVQHFWKRWHTDYLNILQQRPKWTSPQPNIKEGDLVLIREDNQGPLMWKLGRIDVTHAGRDGLVRVVTVRTANGSYKRPITKISMLPLDQDEKRSEVESDKTTDSTRGGMLPPEKRGNQVTLG